MLQGHGDGEAHRRQAPIPEQRLGIGGKFSHDEVSFAGDCRNLYKKYNTFLTGKTRISTKHHPRLYTGAHKKVIQEITIMASVRRGW